MAKKEECPHKALAAKLNDQAAQAGISLVDLIALISKYGPQAIEIVQAVLALLPKKGG